MDDTLHVRRSDTFTLVTEPSETVRKVARNAFVLAALGLVAYAMVSAWHVIGDLRAVRLSDVAHALDSVSVGDAILCVVGYKVGAELLRAVTDRRRNAG